MQEHQDFLDAGGGKKETFVPMTQSQSELHFSILTNEVSVGIGPAGVGKTFTAAAATAKLLQERKVKQVIITRANVTVGETIGMLPGTIEEKMAPLLAPILEALKRTLGAGAYQAMINSGKIKMLPFEYVRGRSFKDTVVIVDEAQNLKWPEIVAICTRYESGRMVLLGDPFQNDVIGENTLARFGFDPEKTGIERLADFNEKHNLGIGFTDFQVEDIVRSGFVRSFLTALYAGH